MIDNHIDNHIDQGTLRASLDEELDTPTRTLVTDHVNDCEACANNSEALAAQAAGVRAGFDTLPRISDAHLGASQARAWAAMQVGLDTGARESWSGSSVWRRFSTWSIAGAAVAAALVVALTVTPVRAWAESLLAVFRVEHFTILELNASNGLQNNQLLNESIGHILSNEVKVTQSPTPPQPLADQAAAIKAAGFPVKLLVGQTPSSLMLESGAGAQMKLDRERLQSILDEAGRGDLRIPAAVDGATIAVRVPAGVMAQYGACGKAANARQHSDGTCISLMELPSPVASMPQEIDPAQLAQVALEAAGMSANDAANFTQTVDWTSTLVLPVMRGESSYEQVHVNGNEGILLRPKAAQLTTHYMLMWVDTGIVYALSGVGDDTTALNLASQLE